MLRELGVEPRDRVGIVIPNVPAFVIWYYACLRLGAVAVSISTRLGSEEVAFILSDCGAKVVVGADTTDVSEMMAGELPDCIEHVLSVSPDAMQVSGEPLASSAGTESSGTSMGKFRNMEPDDPATILYTSGTTGFPKGATLSHRNVRATVHAFNHLCGMGADERLLLSVPLFHCYGQNALLNSGFNVGATIVLQRRFDLAEAKRLITEHQITMLFGVPMTFQLMLKSCEPSNLASIRYCFSAAAKLPEQLAESWREKFRMPIFEGYGLTETAPFASYNHRLKYVPGSIGTPVDLVEMKIVDAETGQECPPGIPGEIAIRGPNVMLGYWNRPQETAAAIRDGWFYSGDIGQVDDNGYFYIVDRLKDMIVVSGLKVYPAEVERVLLDHPSVAEAAVVGFPDDVLGEKVVAFIVPAGNATPTADDIRAHCHAHLGSYKVPGRVVCTDELPRNPAGKVLKTRLREIELPDSPEGNAYDQQTLDQNIRAPLPAIGPLVQRLQSAHAASRQRLLISVLQDELQSLTGQTEPPDPDQPIINEAVDSLVIVEFRDRLQTQIGSGVQLPATIVFDHPKLSELAAHLLGVIEDGGGTSPPPIGDLVANTPGREIRSPESEPNGQQVVSMTEEEAMEALLREVNDG